MNTIGAPPLLDALGRAGAIGGYTVDAVWLGDAVAFVSGEGEVRIWGTDGERAVAQAHEGGALCAARDPSGGAVLTGGDDGRVVRTAPDGGPTEVTSFGRRWVDHLVAGGASGVIACAVGRETVVLGRDGQPAARFAAASGIGGLALDTKGRRLAVARYGGADVWWALAPDAARKDLKWAGSHLTTSWSPDGRFLVTAMQENALHGWRLADAADMRMSGYPAKTHSFSWTADGKWLATSGANAVICWPFAAKDGPMGKPPRELGPAGALVTRVACHPKEPVIAAGYEDGSVLLLRLSDGVPLVAAGAGGGPVSALSWSAKGQTLAFGTEEGRVGLLPLIRR